MTVDADRERAGVWPPYLTTARALEYADVSRSTLNRAVRRGELPVYGRAGGRGTRRFRREDIDRWLAGDVNRDERAMRKLTAPVRAPSARSTTNADATEALARIRAVAKGGVL